jgi:hypothetical protein
MNARQANDSGAAVQTIRQHRIMIAGQQNDRQGSRRKQRGRARQYGVGHTMVVECIAGQ